MSLVRYGSWATSSMHTKYGLLLKIVKAWSISMDQGDTGLLLPKLEQKWGCKDCAPQGESTCGMGHMSGLRGWLALCGGLDL